MPSQNELESRDPVAEKLDDEIANLRAQISSLKSALAHQTSTLLTAPSTLSLLNEGPAPSKSRPVSSSSATKDALLAHAAKQVAHTQQNLYRSLVGVTAFKVRDPNPFAVDGGSVLGLRFEAAHPSKPGRFVRPYYVFLHRAWADSSFPSNHEGNGDNDGGGRQGEGGAGADSRKCRRDEEKTYLHVHKHTVPPCIPLDGLAARYLPPPRRRAAVPASGETGRKRRRATSAPAHESPPLDDDAPLPKQSLPAFARALRREIVRYHNRVATIVDLKRAAGLAPPLQPLSAAAADTTTAGASRKESAGTRKRKRYSYGFADSGSDGEAEDAILSQLSVLSSRGQEDSMLRPDPLEITSLHPFGAYQREREAAAWKKSDRIVDILPADPAAKMVEVEWADGRKGRIVMDDDGGVERVVVHGPGGQDREAAREVLRLGRVEGWAERLRVRMAL